MRLRRTATLLALAAVGVVAVTAAIVARTAFASTVPNDPRYPEQWSMTRIRANEAWDVTHGSMTIKVALLDTGVGYSATPADLVGNIGPAYNTFTGGNTAQDDYGTYGSGTSAAGIIGARTNNTLDVAGTSWNVTILPVKVCNFSGMCPHTNIASGVSWAVGQGAHIIHISPALSTTTTQLDQAVASAISAGRLVVSPSAEPAIGVGYPGSLPGVIAVGSSTSSDTVATFSGGGGALDLVAPGQSVLTLVSGGCCVVRSGSNYAAAHVTGALALMLAAGVPASQAPGHLFNSAVNIGPGGWDSASGWGRLDVCGALNRAGRVCPTGGTGPSPTPTRTNTPAAPTSTPTRTNTPLVPTNTPTRTPTRTNTPAVATSTPTRTPTNSPTPCKGGPGKCGTPTHTPTARFSYCRDVTGDGWIDLEDALLVANHFGEIGSGRPWDIDNNGYVDLEDAQLIMQCF